MRRKSIKRNSLFLNYFKPSVYINNINRINISSLKKNGIKLIFCDLDNTLMPLYRRIPNHNNLELLKRVKENGIRFILISNNIKKRVEFFAKKAGIQEYYWNSKKPFLKFFKEVKRKYKLENNEMIMIGDQLISDVLFANRAHIDSILVKPLTSETNDSKLANFIEKFIYKRLAQENILFEGIYNSEDLISSYELL